VGRLVPGRVLAADPNVVKALGLLVAPPDGTEDATPTTAFPIVGLEDLVLRLLAA
jgi:hypothetical protein